MNEFDYLGDKLLAPPAPGAVTDYGKVENLEASAPHVTSAWTHAIVALADNSECIRTGSDGQIAPGEVTEKLGVVIVGVITALLVDRMLEENASTDECLLSLVRSLIMFKEAFPNWMDAYASAYMIFIEGRNTVSSELRVLQLVAKVEARSFVSSYRS